MLQRSDEWFQARLGSLGSSRVPDALAQTKTGWGASRDRARADLIRERMSGIYVPGYKSFAMQQGTEREPAGRAAYQDRLNAGKFANTIEIEEVALVRHPKITWAHASPDGYVGKDGLVELKCPEAHTHLDTLDNEKIPDNYLKQAMWQMACTGRKWVDYVSYCPDWPLSMQLWVSRIKRDPAMIKKMEEQVVVFLHETQDQLTRICKRYGVKPALTAPVELEFA